MTESKSILATYTIDLTVRSLGADAADAPPAPFLSDLEEVIEAAIESNWPVTAKAVGERTDR